MLLEKSRNNSSDTSSPVYLAGLFFSVASLLPFSFALDYNETIEYIWLASYVLSGLYLIVIFSPRRLRFIAAVFLLFTGFCEYRLWLLPVFFLWLTKNRSLEFAHKDLFSVWLFSLPALFLLFNLLGYFFGFPVSGLIWFFGLPLFLLSFFLGAFAKKKAVSGLIVCNAILVFYSFLAEKKPPTFYQLKAEQSASMLDKNSFLGITEKTKTINTKDVSRISIQNSIVTAILPEVPELLRDLPVNNNSGLFFLFGEHDNLNNYIKGNLGKEFNADRYQRKGPWSVYNPIFNYAFFPNSNRYLMYCSNLGCTLNDRIHGLPLIWDYNAWGVPRILGKVICQGSSKLYLFGDSDPIVGFLAPYNRLFLHDVYDTTTSKWLPLFFSILIIGICFYSKNKYTCFAAAILVIATAIMFQANITTKGDINIVTDGKWLSPHYDHHFSSLPKKLAKTGHTVSINKECIEDSYNILIVIKYADLIGQKCESTKNIVLGMPKAEITLPNGQTVIPQDVPLGGSKVTFNDTAVFISDMRNLALEDGTMVEGSLRLNQTCVIGTGSPAEIDATGLFK